MLKFFRKDCSENTEKFCKNVNLFGMKRLFIIGAPQKTWEKIF